MPPVYLDCNATTPIDPEVLEVVNKYLHEEYGNEGSRTHEYGTRAKQAVQLARDEVAAVVGAKRDEVIFTSGATESNNLAILGLQKKGKEINKPHIITSSIEHKAVSEPIDFLESLGFEVSRVPVSANGAVEPREVEALLRDETLLISIMQVNNETGVRQPISEIANMLEDHHAYFHTDAAQGFGKDLKVLRNQRIDLISISGHKIFAPKGIGALIMRKRGYVRPPLNPLTFGGGQERGLRPGTLPVALIAGLGAAAKIAVRDHQKRLAKCNDIKKEAIQALSAIKPYFTGDQELVANHVLNLRIEGLDSEALIVALKDLVSISNGSACTSSSYKPSHVLQAMGMTDDEANGCVRLSWCHLTGKVDWLGIVKRIRSLLV